MKLNKEPSAGLNKEPEPVSKVVKRQVLKMLAVVASMFVFAIWIMPPLYTLFCDLTGLNGKTGGPYKTVNVEIDTSRSVRVQFLASNNENMPWEFRPVKASIFVHPGAETEITYFAKNVTNRAMVAQAIPSLVPFKAAEYFHKTECFCFNQQPLEAGGSVELPLRFIVDQDIPKHIHTITLSYTLFDVTEQKADLLANLVSEKIVVSAKKFVSAKMEVAKTIN